MHAIDNRNPAPSHHPAVPQFDLAVLEQLVALRKAVHDHEHARRALDRITRGIVTVSMVARGGAITAERRAWQRVCRLREDLVAAFATEVE